ncbi:uncharacterized protein LOC106638592 [Copidosoma floridanum]|uniref:uncharacterized protein LOC106638592 n=1 Tax=Copidosoma floridanum TaxID=29053 RepID=UPI0006C95DAE|nr:uncharacterized protein LOC106638592 [Copidosoma floridanum]
MHVVIGLLVCALLSHFLLGPTCQATSHEGAALTTRRKRYLIFPQGSNVQVVFCLTIGSEGRPAGQLVVGMTAALAWELPAKVDSLELHRRSRSVVYPKIEAFLQSLGLDGRSCVMKALCEAGQRSPSSIGRADFLHELLHAIFTIREDGTRFESEEHRQYDHAHGSYGNCTELYPTCKYSIYDLNF